jgi:hypothetical protein
MSDPPTRIEQFNAAVRGVVTLVLIAGFVWGFIVEKVSGEVFSTVVAGVIGYWFASRDTKASAGLQPTTTMRSPDTTVITGPTPPVAG